MLKDERSRALGSNFAGQWLFLRNLRGLQPDADVFPDFDHNLREAMQRETEMLFESVVLEDKSVLRLLDADYTYVNERLARHYGIPNVYGTQFRKVAVSDEARRGLLGQGSILALTSQNNRTSPVLRGKYVLTNILGTPPPEAPANVPPLDETPAKAQLDARPHGRAPAQSDLRELPQADGSDRALTRELRRDRPLAHGGQRRGNRRVRTTGRRLEDRRARGAASGAAAAARHVRAQRDRDADDVRARPRVEYYDMPYVRAILKESAKNDYRFSSLVLGIIKSPAFQRRRAES